MKNTGYILALCLTASGHVLAHDVWITGKQAENNITAEIGYGHNFPSKGTIPDRRNFFENPRIYNGKETITLKPASTDYVYKTESASKDNGYVLSTYMKPGYWFQIKVRYPVIGFTLAVKMYIIPVHFCHCGGTECRGYGAVHHQPVCR